MSFSTRNLRFYNHSFLRSRLVVISLFKTRIASFSITLRIFYLAFFKIRRKGDIFILYYREFSTNFTSSSIWLSNCNLFKIRIYQLQNSNNILIYDGYFMLNSAIVKKTKIIVELVEFSILKWLLTVKKFILARIR